ncbi:MAG: hypothetical protein K1X94_07780 [Sandaracinaceae bacterium]|nr:hypothetical protein [Sandaracinaceae bacterium]
MSMAFWIGLVIAAVALVIVTVVGGFDAGIVVPWCAALVVAVIVRLVWMRVRFACPSCGARRSVATGEVTSTTLGSHVVHHGSGLSRHDVLRRHVERHHPRRCLACGAEFTAVVESHRRRRVP